MRTIPLLGLAAALLQSPDESVFHQPSEADPIAFAVVTEQGSQLQVGIFSEKGRLAVWENDEFSDGAPLTLEPWQRFILPPRHDVLGILDYLYPCLAGTGLSRVAGATRLLLPIGLPDIEPPIPSSPPIPGPDPVLTVQGASVVELSDAARMVAFLEAGLHPDLPGRARLFRRLEPNSGEYTAAGEYEFDARGEFQSSADGGLIAHADGSTLRLFDANGERQLALRGDFFLAPDARWIALVSEAGVEFTNLEGPDRQGEPLGAPVTLGITGPIREVRFLGDRALVVERTRAVLVDVRTGQTQWTRGPSRGAFTSADLLEPSPGRLLIALGSLDVLRVPRRQQAKPAPGAAFAQAEVFELDSPERLANVSFELGRWTHDQPWVRLAGTPARLIALTSDEVRISLPLP